MLNNAIENQLSLMCELTISNLWQPEYEHKRET